MNMETSKMGRIGKIFLYAGLGISYIIAIVFATMLFYPITPITYTKGTMPFKVLNTMPGHNQRPTVTAGQILVYEVRYCRHTSAPADVQRTLVGPVTTLLNRTSSQAKKGCAISKVANTVVPSYLPPGIYHMDININYHINPLKDVQVQTRTVNFEVIAPPVDKDGNAIPQPIIIPEINNQPGTISGGTLDDEEIRNQVAPPQGQSLPNSNPTPPTQRSNQQPSEPPPAAQPIVPAEPSPEPVTPATPVRDLICRLTLGLLLCS